MPSRPPASLSAKLREAKRLIRELEAGNALLWAQIAYLKGRQSQLERIADKATGPEFSRRLCECGGLLVWRKIGIGRPHLGVAFCTDCTSPNTFLVRKKPP